MNKCNVIIAIIALIVAGSFSSSFANGYSFYERIAVEENGNLKFKVALNNDLPKSQKEIKSCYSFNRDPSCISEVLSTLENELSIQPSQNMKAWKNFLIGTVNYELKHFKKSAASYEKVVEQTNDLALKPAAIHRLINSYFILRDTKPLISNLEMLSKDFPSYRTYPREFDTYPMSFCDPAWFVCGGPAPLSEIKKSIPKLQSIEAKQKALSTLSPDNINNVESYVQASIELGKLYEEVCPIQTMFQTICPDAVEVYRTVYNRFPKHVGADYAFLRLQKSKFSYEYEGDHAARSKDILKLYIPFLEQYPDSPHAEGIRKEVQKAEKILNTSSK